MAFTQREQHGKVRPKWRTNTNAPVGRMIGIEFEIEHDLGYKKILDALPEPKHEHNRPVTERDASLREACGVEIVFPPYNNAALKTSDPKKSYFAKAMKALEEAGAVSNINCGMHMNVNTEGWTLEQKGAFVYWLHRVPAAVLTRIGGRQLTGYCTQYGLAFEDAKYHVDHVTCAGVRPNRIEVRFPQATMDMNRIKNLTNFFELLEDYVKTEAGIQFLRRNPGRDDLLAAFITFLNNHESRPRTAAAIKEILLNGYPA